MTWTQLKTSTLAEIIDWAQTQPFAQAMAECQQDAEWHAEGDVWTHTKMVCEQLPLLEAWDTLTAHEKTVLIFTALFHDAAKPLTTVLEEATGRVRSPNHAVKGEHLARRILRELECPLQTREQITSLVRFHGRPAFLMEKAVPAHEVVRLSWLTNNRLLYLFALADTRGRATDCTDRSEDNLHLWKLEAEEHNCFDQPYAFPSHHARFTFLRSSTPDLHYVPHEDFSCRVTLMCGLPGSGKDTWLAEHRSELPVVSLDDLRKEHGVSPTDNQGQIVQLGKERCREHLRSRTSFAFNATNLQKQTRERWISLFTDYNAEVEIISLEPPIKDLLRQNRNRPDAVPENVVRKLAERLEPPTWLEAHHLTFIPE